MTDTDGPARRRDPITYRNPTIVIALLAYVAEVNDDDHKPTWDEVVDHITAQVEWRTADNIVRELCNFGALYRHGTVRGRNNNRTDTRALSITTLGRHWLEGTTPPPITEGTDTE